MHAPLIRGDCIAGSSGAKRKGVSIKSGRRHGRTPAMQE